MARKLGRTVDAIIVRAARLGIRRMDSFLTAADIARIFGLPSAKTVTHNWVRKGWLPATRNKTAGNKRSGYWRFSEADVKKFIREHPDQIVLARIDRTANSYWYNFVRSVVPANNRASLARLWTPDEDAYILNNKGQRTYAQMAERLGRTVEAIHGRFRELRHKHERLVQAHPLWESRLMAGKPVQGRRWTEEEKEYLRLHIMDMKAKEIAEAVGHSVLSVNKMASRMGITRDWVRAHRERQDASDMAA